MGPISLRTTDLENDYTPTLVKIFKNLLILIEFKDPSVRILLGQGRPQYNILSENLR